MGKSRKDRFTQFEKKSKNQTSRRGGRREGAGRPRRKKVSPPGDSLLPLRSKKDFVRALGKIIDMAYREKMSAPKARQIAEMIKILFEVWENKTVAQFREALKKIEEKIDASVNKTAGQAAAGRSGAGGESSSTVRPVSSR